MGWARAAFVEGGGDGGSYLGFFLQENSIK